MLRTMAEESIQKGVPHAEDETGLETDLALVVADLGGGPPAPDEAATSPEGLDRASEGDLRTLIAMLARRAG
jgi:hypothetical protein